MSDDIPPFPVFEDLHERHHGLTETFSRTKRKGAAICMQRHHTSPKMHQIASGLMLTLCVIPSEGARGRVEGSQFPGWATRDPSAPLAGSLRSG